jgi:thiol-disulfide isomerase/thioredoxin
LLVIANGPPGVPPIAAADAASRPYVVKLHARWCPICMTTKQQWSEIEQDYADRVNLFVIDNTTPSTRANSRAQAEKFGLAMHVDRYQGATGAVIVIDGRSKAVLSELFGRRPIEDYRAAIDAAVKAAGE